MDREGKTILVVEDDAKIRQLVRIYLEQAGYDVTEAADGKEAKEQFRLVAPCFVIIDLMLPKVSGEGVCKWIREEMKSDIPLIMLTAKVSESDRIKGLQMGADDYVTKPFSPRELVARVETVLRRTSERCNKLSYRGLTVWPNRGEAVYRGQRLELTSHEFRLLQLLMSHPNQVMSRGQMIDRLYPNQQKVVTDRTIDVHIGKLREKLSQIDGKKTELIETVRGMGYRFVAY